MKHAYARFSVIAFAAVVLLFFTQCNKEQFADSSDQNVTFSADKVLFDTVFTTICSTTLPLKVYNPHNDPIVYSNIDVMGGADSPFRIAVDGLNGTGFQGLEIGPNDSAWVFVEVTIDPNGATSALIEEDSVRFITNGNIEYVHLVAWGQDAFFHGGLGALTVLGCDEVWNADKPHVIYGIVAVDEGCSLTINPGTQVHCRNASGLYVFKGSLDVQGELGNEVCFQGDRLEPEYADVPGQWGIQLQVQFETGFGVEQATINRGGIWLFETQDCEIDHAIIKNGIIGIQCDTTGTSTGESLRINNTVVTNMSAIGIYTQGAHVSGSNCLFSNCGQNCAAFSIGGKYDFHHTTFANYWTQSNRQSPAFYINNYYVDVDQNVQVRPLLEANFTNCIMYGNNAELSDFNEFVYDFNLDAEQPNYFFNDCYVDTDQDILDGSHFSNMSQGQGEPPFVEPFAGNFDFPGPVASAFRSQTGFINTTTDIEGVFRSGLFARGCYMDD